MDIIAERIKAVRETKRIKQSEIAAALGIDSSNYAKLEKRGEKLTLEQLGAVADALGIFLIDLLDTGHNPDKSEREKELEKEVLELDQENIELNRTIKAFTIMSETMAKQNEIIAKQNENIKKYDNQLEELAKEILLTFDNKDTKDKVLKFLRMFIEHPVKH